MKEAYLEQKVGAFVLIGLVAIAVLIVVFGRFGQLFQSTYDIYVAFPNASGIIKNSQVLYRGAKVGSVPAPPKIIDQGKSVELTLRIYKNVRIPRNAEFRIGVYGLLGDRYVDIVPPVSELRNDQGKIQYLEHGDRVQGAENVGLNSLIETAEQKLQKFGLTLEKLLTDQFIQDFHEGMQSAKSMLESGEKIFAEATQGKGVIYKLLNDSEMARNLKQLIYNLRVSGVLFYSDVATEEAEDDTVTTGSIQMRAARTAPYSSRR